MKKIFLKADIISLMAILIFWLTGCMKDKITRTYQINIPVYETLTKFRQGIVSQPAAAITATGKISVYGKFIFLSEPGKGIHVIDNSNPASPKNVSFINIPGNEDMAIKGNSLYADAYGDLVTFDISDPAKAITKDFETYVFPDQSIYYAGSTINPDSINVIVGWTTKDTTVNYDNGNSGYQYPMYYSNCAACASVLAASQSTNTTATNGSTARFAIINNSLYTVGSSSLTAFDISQRFKPVFTGITQVSWNVETIYPLEDKLFIGTNNGMYMYDVQFNPSSPSLLGMFSHVRTCDPVIADGNYAYVTLRSGSTCQGFNNELDVLDITDMSNPSLLKVYQLTNPQGLSKDGSNLFICDGTDGLKVYNASDVNNLQLIKQLKDAEMADVIAEGGLAIAVAKDGIYQYDYSDLGNIHLISTLKN
jgi:hypothetical protein